MSKITLLLLLLFLSPTSAFLTQVLSLVSFGYKTYDFISSKVKESHDISNEQLLEKITERIKTANVKLLKDIRLELKLDQLENAVKVIHSSLQDLKYVVDTSESGDFKTNVRKFVDNFEKSNVLVETRWLPEMLSDPIPGRSGTLLELISQSNNCNRASTETFEVFYRSLVSDGIALHFAYSALYAYPNITDVQLEEVEWNKTAKDIHETLNQWIASCKFQTIYPADFTYTNDAEVLWKSSKKRYPLLWNDVMFFSDVSTYQFLYQRNEIHTSFWHQGNSKNKYQVFGPLAEKPIWIRADVISELQALENDFRSSFEGVDDIEAAVHVGDSVVNHLTTEGYIIRNIIVFFENEDFRVDKVLLHQDSPVANISVNNVKLRYCYDNGRSCDVGLNNRTKTRAGTFRVFVYPEATDNHAGHLEVSSIFLMTVITVYRFV